MAFVLQGGVAQVNSGDFAFHAFDFHVVGFRKGTVDEQQHTGENVRDSVFHREAEGKTGQAQAGHQRGDIHAQRAERGDEAGNE